MRGRGAFYLDLVREPPAASQLCPQIDHFFRVAAENKKLASQSKFSADDGIMSLVKLAHPEGASAPPTSPTGNGGKDDVAHAGNNRSLLSDARAY